MNRFATFFLLAIAIVLSGCTHRPSIDQPTAAFRLLGTDGQSHQIPERDPNARFTVIVFFADHCPCQAAHDARLRDLYAQYHSQGVAFYFIDSEVRAQIDRDREEAKKRDYAFPILIDHGAVIASRLGVDYATETYVFDRDGVVHYRGGIDSDRKHLHDDAAFYLKDALDDLLAGREAKHRETEALGCSLETW
jgi:peroxiredoxin